jgi:hypothetical protein
MLKKLFRKPETKPLPSYPKIEVSEIPAASTLLFYGFPGNKLTQLVGNRVYGHSYNPPAFHAAFYLTDGLLLNVGKFRRLHQIEKEFKSTRRIDAISYPGISPETRRVLCKEASLDTSSPRFGLMFPDYAFTDYARFLFKIFRPSKRDFCSENVVETFAKADIRVSDLKPVETAPWDLQEFAEAHPEACEIRTLWVGGDFPS